MNSADPPKPEHPGIAKRKADYWLLKKIEHKLKRRRSRPAFQISQLREVLTVCGAPFEIDEEEPIDFEPRYFTPGSVEDLENGLNLSKWSWSLLRPIQYVHHSSEENLRVVEYAFNDMMDRASFCQYAIEEVSKWACHQYIPTKTQFGKQNAWHRPCGCVEYAFCRTGEFYMWPRGEGRDKHEFNPDIPHSMATVLDTWTPRSDDILWSELMLAVSMLKGSVRNAKMYPHHKVCPGLIFSIHGRFSARITQVHISGRRLVIRPSRILNFHTPVVNDDVRLVLRWMNSCPIGDTKLPFLGNFEQDDEEKATNPPDTSGPPRHAISVDDQWLSLKLRSLSIIA